MIAASTLIGMQAASDLDTQYNEMAYIRQIFSVLQSEIRYHRAFLSEAFSNIAGFVKSPYDVWMRQLYLRLERKDDGCLTDVWKETIDEYLIDLKIPRRQKEQIKELGNYLGNADIELQVRHIDLLEEQLETAMKEMQGELENKKKLCRCFGIMGGIFLAVLFI